MTAALPQVVIFDWDNTLVDSWGAIMAGMNATFADFGMPSWTMDEVKARCKYAAKDYFPQLFGPKWEDAVTRYYVHFNAARQKQTTKARPGAVDLLRWLKNQKIPSCVVSNKKGIYLRQEAAELNWNEYFVSLVGSADAPNNKPARDPVDMALKPTGHTAAPDVWFVGDTDVDVECARNSGCTPVLVGEVAVAQLLKVDLVFDDCVALCHWLAKAHKEKK